MPTTTPVPITDVTYVDDEAIFITGAHNEELVANIKQVANMVDKTEVIVIWAGKHVEGVPGVLLENGRVSRFVQKDKHLGSLVSATPSSALEIREKIKKATRAFHALAKKVFLHHEIDIILRTRLFNALVVSILLYNAEYKCDGYTFSISDACERWTNSQECLQMSSVSSPRVTSCRLRDVSVPHWTL